jgi:two-component system chemotaxis sensor kinase CheA
MLHDFLANAEELMEQLSESVLALENDPTSKDAIEQIFRAAHTIKGTAGMFGFRAIQRLTHVMESLFDQIRKGQVVATTDSGKLLFVSMRD